MKRLGWLALVLGVFFCTATAEGAKKPKAKPGPKVDLSADSKGADSSAFLTAPLLAPEVASKLKLTAEQRPQVDKLQREFSAKQKEIADKVRALGTQPAAPAKGAKGAKGTKSSPASDLLQDAAKLREDYEEKLNEVLTDAQKEMLTA